MSIRRFVQKHGAAPRRPVKSVIANWLREKKAKDFLGQEIMAGILVADLLENPGLIDHRVPEELRLAFKNLMGEKRDSHSEIIDLIKEKLEISPNSIDGLRWKIQGQLGEDVFVSKVGEAAKLAGSGSQEGWDVSIHHSDHVQYVQVKVYADADQVIEKIKQVNDKLSNGLIANESGSIVENIDFAVNDDIFEEVHQRVEELGLQNKILNIGKTHAEIQEAMKLGVDVAKDGPFDAFFSELIGGIVAASAIHAASNAFLVWWGAKEQTRAIDDTLYSSAISAGGIGATMLTEAVLVEAALFAELEVAAAIISGPIGGVLLLGVGIGARGLLKRITDRRHTSERLQKGNQELAKLCNRLGILDSNLSEPKAA